MTQAEADVLIAQLGNQAAFMIAKGAKRHDVAHEFIAMGVPRNVAYDIVDAVESAIRRQVRERGGSMLGTGVLALLLGGGATVLTGGAVLFYGAIAVGAALTLGGGLMVLTGKHRILGLQLA